MSPPLPQGDDVLEAPPDLAPPCTDARAAGAGPLPEGVQRWPLAPGQTERWLAAHLGSHARLALNESACLVLTGALDMAALEAAILEVLQRHDAFRMRFGVDEPWQALDPAARPTLQRIDLSAHADPSAALDEFCAAAVRHDFVLDQAPMARFSLIALSAEVAAFHLVYSHLVCDGWSLRTIMSELAKALRSRQAGQATSLRPASAPGPFATQLLQRWNGADGESSAAYWRSVMRQPPPLLELGDLAPPAARRFGAGSWVAEVDTDTLRKLQGIAQQHEATLFPVLLAAMAVALQRRSGRDDFTIAIPLASQALVRGPALVADGAIDLPLRVSCHAGEPFGEVLVRLRDRVADALKHPFATQVRVARDVGARSLGNRPPLTGILCNMIPRLNPRTFEPLHARGHEGDKPYLLGELMFNLLLDVDALTITLHYSTDFFSRGRAGELVAELQAVLAEVAGTVATGGPDVDAAPEASREPASPRPSADAARLLDHWVAQLSPLPSAFALPSDRRRPALTSGRAVVSSDAWSAEEWNAVRALADRLGIPPAVVMLAAFGILLHRLGGQQDLIVGLSPANPAHAEAGGSNATRALRLSFDASLSVAQAIAGVHRAWAQAWARAAVPTEPLLQRLGVARDAARAPLHQAAFGFHDATAAAGADDRLATGEGTSLEFLQDLSLRCHVDAQGLRHRLTANADVIDGPGVALIAGRLRTLASSMALHADAMVAALDLRPPEELALLARWNATSVPLDATLRVQDLITEQSLRSPDAAALIGVGRASIGYRDLERQSNRLARLLRARGAGRGALVGLCLERGPALVVALLAVLKSGAAYVPLDPAYPAARLAFMARDAQLALLITDTPSGGALGLGGPAVSTINLDRDTALIDAQDERPLPVNLSLDATGDDLAYVIYTSGSTGQPKGVKVPHRAVVNFLRSMAVEPGLGPKHRLLAVTTFSFDIAVLELLLPLTLGAQVVIAPRAQAQDGAALRALLYEQAVTAMQATPSTWRALLDAGWQAGIGFKALVGGEALAPDLAAALLDRGVELWNLYGPTETTVWSTCWKVERPEDGILVGTPIANTQVHVLDAVGRACPIGVAGELWIGGMGVASGYLGRPELTAERFVPDAAAGSGSVLYRTGDRGRWRSDGRLEHLGRLDHQVKLRGHRIELGEIEVALAGHPGVAVAVVRVREDVPGDQRLVAYIVPCGPMPAIHGLRAHLATLLPAYMLPQHYVGLEALPLLPNGKIDRSALPAPMASLQTIELPASPAEPRTATQERVWQLWREVLAIDAFSVHDNFFDLGGHSLLAMTLVSRLNARFEAALTLNAILQAPTVALMARLIDGEGADHDSLLALRAGGSEAPLFLMHDASGEALMYRSLALRLSPCVPVYALRPLAADGVAMVHTRIEDMAAHYVARIRSVQPHGPYRLGGLCSGGVVAFEVALQLQRAGERITVLALIDSPDAAVRPLPGRFVARRLKALAHDVGAQASPARPLASARAALVMAGRLGELAVELLRTRAGMVRSYLDARRLRACLDQGRPPSPRLRRLTAPQVHLLAQADYRNRERLESGAILFRATRGNGDAGDEPFVGLFRDPRLGWARSIAGPIECVDVPGGHFSMLSEPHVQSVASVLQARLDAVPPMTPASTA